MPNLQLRRASACCRAKPQHMLPCSCVDGLAMPMLAKHLQLAFSCSKTLVVTYPCNVLADQPLFNKQLHCMLCLTSTFCLTCSSRLHQAAGLLPAKDRWTTCDKVYPAAISIRQLTHLLHFAVGKPVVRHMHKHYIQQQTALGSWLTICNITGGQPVA